MAEVTALKQRLLSALRDERRTLSYFNGRQREAILEMISDGLIKVRDRALTITTRGRNALKAKGEQS